ncbi:MAG: hypothetical protein JW958_09955 [Candidatus Eisenbacteria bacterium]|nr:hypothetical protein [Candidatus Eisenbacteria bacterium]
MRIQTFLLLSAALLASPASGGEGALLYDRAEGGAQGWATPTGRLLPGPAGLELRIADPVSSFLSPGGLAVDAGRVDRVEIDLRVEPPGTGAFLYWTDDAENGFVPQWRVPIPEGRSVTRLSGSPFWRGSIDRFLLAPEPGATRVVLSRFETRGPRGAGERSARLWRRFWETELRAQYSVNGILGARVGPLPFPLLVGVLSLLIPLLLGMRGGKKGRGERIRRGVRAGLFAGAFLLALRSGADMIQTWRVDDAFYAGKSLSRKMEAANPPGFWRLLRESKDWIPPGERVEVRAERPYPYEKAAFYLYPRRTADGARYVVSYRAPAPPDSNACEEILRIEGTGTLYRRMER